MKGTVYRSTGSWYQVKNDAGEMLDCRIKGKFRIKGIKSTNPVAVGDIVDYTIDTTSDEETGVINQIHDRKNYIIRKSVNLSKQTHIIAANVDLVFLLVTLNNPPTFTSFIDRLLATAMAYDIQAIILFNKIDTYEQTELDEIKWLAHIYRDAGYQCLGISAATGKNIDQVKDLMKDKTVMFAGHSGAGKSTLANAIQPALNLKTKQISSQHKQGQHTTTFATMHDLDIGARLIDTPGIKGFGIVEMEKEEIGDYFPEIFEHKQHCKFNNCLHIEEPKCAVKEAVENGEIHDSRYESYVKMITDDEDNYRADIYGS